MPVLADIRGLWRIPEFGPRCPANSDSSTTSSRLLSKKVTMPASTTPSMPPLPPSTLRKVAGISDPSVTDLSPAEFWKRILEGRKSTPTVMIVGDLIRDRIEEKSLPLYVFSNITLIVASTLPHWWEIPWNLFRSFWKTSWDLLFRTEWIFQTAKTLYRISPKERSWRKSKTQKHSRMMKWLLRLRVPGSRIVLSNSSINV